MFANGGDKALWLVVAFAGGFAYGYVPRFLQYVADLAAVKDQPVEKATKQLRQNAENVIQLGTLDALFRGPNYFLESTTLRMIVAKFTKTSEKARLLESLSADDWASRDRAINVLKLFLHHPALVETDIRQRFSDKRSFQAIVRALNHVNNERSSSENGGSGGDLNEEGNAGVVSAGDSAERKMTGDFLPSPVKPTCRPAHEKSLMEILYSLFNDLERMGLHSYNQESLKNALDAGLVTEWLAKYPFPIKSRQLASYNYDRWSIVDLFEREIYYEDDPDMARLVNAIKTIPLGARQLRASGLWRRIRWDLQQEVTSLNFEGREQDDGETASAGSRQVSPARDDDNNDVLMIDGEQTAGFAGRGRPGLNGRSPEEERVRRRHRQAVVVAEAGAPLRPENILHRQPTETDMRSFSPFLVGDQATEADSIPPVDPTDVVDLDALLEAIRPTAFWGSDEARRETETGHALDQIDGIDSGAQPTLPSAPVDIELPQMNLREWTTALDDAAVHAVSESRRVLNGDRFVPEGVKQEVYRMQDAISAWRRRETPAALPGGQPAPDLAQCVVKLNQIGGLIMEEAEKDA